MGHLIELMRVSMTVRIARKTLLPPLVPQRVGLVVFPLNVLYSGLCVGLISVLNLVVDKNKLLLNNEFIANR